MNTAIDKKHEEAEASAPELAPKIEPGPDFCKIVWASNGQQVLLMPASDADGVGLKMTTSFLVNDSAFIMSMIDYSFEVKAVMDAQITNEEADAFLESLRMAMMESFSSLESEVQEGHIHGPHCNHG